MIVRCILLAFFIPMLELVSSNITGYVKISWPDSGLRQNRGGGEIFKPTYEENPANRICLGRLGNAGTAWRDCSCGKLLLDHRPAEKASNHVYLPLDQNKVPTHIVLFVGQDHTDAEDRPAVGNCGAATGESREEYSAILPLMFSDDPAHDVLLFPGNPLKVSLQCDANYFGPRCDLFCDVSRSGGSYTCHPQTGEIVCSPGWIGSHCQENVFVDRETASEFLKKSRSRRSLEFGECSERKCTKEELRKEFILTGGVLTEELWNIYNDKNDCEPNPCASNGALYCEDLYQTYTCHCQEGYRGDNCSELDLCHFQPCMNGAACEGGGEIVVCDCPEGFVGQFCENSINHCLDNPCGYSGDCISEDGGFLCVCDEGVTGERCEHQIDDCADRPCLNDGECIDGNNFYECHCEVGYEGKNCEIRISPCSTEPCLNGGECLEDLWKGGFYCRCEALFEGPTCETQLCSEDACNGRGSCTSLGDQKYHCECDSGFTGEFCQTALDPCETLESPCPARATCVNLEGDYMCVCLPGFEGENCEKPCELCEERNELKCEDNPCQNGARCLSDGRNTTCLCSPGFSGSRCEVEVDFCKNDSCASGVCITLHDGFTCECYEGFTGLHCDEDINECETERGLCKNNATCDNLLGAFECICAEGYTGRHCEHKMDCFSDPCHNGGSCYENGDSFLCFCRVGYIGSTCEEIVDICKDEPSPCQNGGQCEVVSLEEQEIKCTCSERFYGRHCEQEIPSCMVKYEDHDGTHKLTERTDCGSYGTCVPGDVDEFTCSCREGYTGRLCDERIRVIECNDAYCKCETGLTNFKALPRKVDNTTKCQHPLYGSGTCDRDECLIEPCAGPAPLICKYETECFEKRISPRAADANATVEPCPHVELHLSASKLPQGCTLGNICDGVRNLQVLQPFRNDTVVNCKVDRMDFNELWISAAVASKTSKYSAQLVSVELFLGLKDIVRSSMAGNGTYETNNTFLTSLKNASFRGQFITPGPPHDDGAEINPLDGGEDVGEAVPEKKIDVVFVVLAVAAAVVFLVGVLFVVFWLRKRKNTQPPNQHQPLHTENNNIPIGSVKWTKSVNLPSTYENPLIFHTDDDKVFGHEDALTQQANSDSDASPARGVSTFLSPNLNSVNKVPTR